MHAQYINIIWTELADVFYSKEEHSSTTLPSINSEYMIYTAWGLLLSHEHCANVCDVGRSLPTVWGHTGLVDTEDWYLARLHPLTPRWV